MLHECLSTSGSAASHNGIITNRIISNTPQIIYQMVQTCTQLDWIGLSNTMIPNINNKWFCNKLNWPAFRLMKLASVLKIYELGIKDESVSKIGSSHIAQRKNYISIHNHFIRENSQHFLTCPPNS